MRDTRKSLAITKMQAIICIVIITFSIVVAAYGLSVTKPAPAAFAIKVVNRPAAFGEQLYSIPNQKYLFLVALDENDTQIQDTQAVTLSATAPECQITVTPQTITYGQVAEVTVIPPMSSIGENVTVTIQAERGGVKQTETVAFTVIEPEEREETLGPKAAELRDSFVQWLSTTHPELGITAETAWTGTVVNPMVLVVMHYMFLSEDWEMYVTWHVMIPPYDWSRIYLRHRFNATAPSLAFEISSVQGQTTPIPIAVEDWV